MNKAIVYIIERGMHCLPDELYLKIKFKKRMGYKLDLVNPTTFSEKLQWLKIHHRKPIYTTLVDKYAFKTYFGRIICEEHIIPTYGVWDDFSEINFDMLPDQFVLKCTHDSGGLVVCRDKSKLDIAFAKRKIDKSMQTNYYWHGREWAYKNVHRRIIAEKFMQDASSKELKDYKFYCFNGEPLFLYLSEGLENHETARMSYVTLDWEKANFARVDYKPFDELPPKPKHFSEMIQIARELSKECVFVRVDLYEINGNIYFGELTLFPGIGMNKFEPPEWDKKLGEKLSLEGLR